MTNKGIFDKILSKLDYCENNRDVTSTLNGGGKYTF